MGWSVIRVSEATKAKLEAVRESMLKGDEVRSTPLFEPDNRDRIGLDQVVLALIEFRERWKERGKRSKEAKKAIRRKDYERQATVAEPGPVSEGA